MPLKVSQLPSEEHALLERAAHWPRLRSLSEISIESLRQLAQSEGADFATAVAYDRLCRSDAHGPAIARLTAIDTAAVDQPTMSRGTVVIVPGAFHRERARQTGADGQVVRDEAERLGYTVVVAPTHSFGSLEENSAIVRSCLAQDFAEPVVLVSLSKGTAEIKWALGEAAATQMLRQVSAWVSLSGMWWGSPLVGWLRARPIRSWFVRQMLRWNGQDFRVLEQLAYGPATPLAREVDLPEGVQLLHVAGYPLERHLCSRMARRGHRRLSAWGPNDAAGLLLADAGRLPGTVFPVWGADHYLRPAHEDHRQLVRRVLLWLHQPRQVKRLSTIGAES